jgi:hypothetical protein
VNGTSTIFSFNTANELPAASGGLNMTYTYDGNGDRTGSSDGTSMTINTAGQLTSVTPPGGGLGRGGGTPINYTYTGPGEQQRIGAGSTKYQYDATGLNVQMDSANNKTYFTSLPDGTLLSETIPSGLANAGTYYYLSDGAGNMAAVVDSGGTVRNSYSYDPLGGASVTGSQQVSNPFTFQGGDVREPDGVLLHRERVLRSGHRPVIWVQGPGLSGHHGQRRQMRRRRGAVRRRHVYDHTCAHAAGKWPSDDQISAHGR